MLHLHPLAFIVLVLGVAIFKLVPAWLGDSQIAQSGSQFPLPSDWTSSGVVVVLLYKAVGPSAWAVAGVTAAVLALVMPVVLWFRRDTSSGLWRVALLVFAAWPAANVTFSFMGTFHMFHPVGMALAVLGRRAWIVGAGFILALGSMPEQSLLAFVTLFVLSLVPRWSQWRSRALLGIALAGAWSIGAAIWFSNAGVVSRMDRLVGEFQLGILANLSAGSLGIYAWWGAWWLLVAFQLATLPRRYLPVSLAATIVIPAFFTFMTHDGTRVFAGVSSAVALVLAWSFLGQLSEDTALKRHAGGRDPLSIRLTVAACFLALILLPNVVSDVWGTSFKSSWLFWVQHAWQRIFGA